VHLLEREQFLPVDVEEAWAFFSSPLNLARITPPDLGLVIRAPFDARPLHTGQRITYTVRPILGIPLTWVTLITTVERPYCFVDTQERGPYAHWRHTHTFTSLPGGTHIHDRVDYELPLGPIGRWVHSSFVRRRLAGIFDHRHQTLAGLFPAR
jgi:ligand-binding SRPBCC domain-containing protein